MNERIRELARQADLQPYYDAQETAIKKFAELLIKRCISEIYMVDVGDLKGRSYYLDKVAEHLEKHFGVEQC